MSERQTGIVKWFNEQKGFGFIIDGKNGADVFVHFKDIMCEGYKTLHENDSVTYILEKGPKGFKAQEVVVTNQ